MCGESFSSMKSLFRHMRRHRDRHWHNILPLDPRNATVIVRRTLLPISPISDLSDSDSLKLNDHEDGCIRVGEVVDLTKFLPAVKTGKRGRPAVKVGGDQVEAVQGCRKDDGVVAEGGGTVVFKFDLNEENEDAVMIMD
ncbi:hypothetical protein L6452_00185 [Arctium lappa]|uniref:Uncharacterized protein n=3 Tax=Arctium lappa TaxID=4217 RepID=A0ACB9FDG3_ARCLA|nr:hypothetical protein L6452_00183 [Arctium lappa]KAI3769087.1 hypothetical protein L6452_00184 [Arctium lappa]KAI3769088.1 hypothetical protein L6452_00185 [Arctium lappa]